MSDEKSNDLTKLERLAALLQDDGIDPESMDPTELDQYLKVSKVDMSGSQKRFAALLEKAKALTITTQQPTSLNNKP